MSLSSFCTISSGVNSSRLSSNCKADPLTAPFDSVAVTGAAAASAILKDRIGLNSDSLAAHVKVSFTPLSLGRTIFRSPKRRSLNSLLILYCS